MKKLLLLSALAACSLPAATPPDLPFEPPPHWTAGGIAGDPRADWWSSFRDDRLAAAVREAVEKNPGLRAAAARVDAALAQARAAAGSELPSVNGSLSASRRVQNFVGLPIPGGPPVLTSRADAFGASLDIGWELDLWGRLRAVRTAADADADAETLDLAAARHSLAAQTLKAWFAAVEARRQVDIATGRVESDRLFADRVRDRYDRGLRPSVELRFALSTLAASEALAHARAQQRDATIRQLELLLGRYPAAATLLSDDLPALPSQPPAGLPAQILSRRPDLFALERRLHASQARIHEARVSLLPKIPLTGSVGTSSSELKDVLDGDFGVWSIAAGLLAPIFEGGRIRAGVDAAKARSRQLDALYVDAALRAFAEVETALAAEVILTRRQVAIESALEQSRAASVLAERRWAAGLDDLLPVLEARRAASESESQLLSVRRLRLDNRVNLHLALGGAFP
jgi:NodT family efflux transporter outer membrane factor (OMF) lipoprotein